MPDGENHTLYAGQTRYWDKVGLRVTYDLALSFAEKMEGQGAYLDDELDEFTTFSADSKDAIKEVETLFANDDISDAILGGENEVINRTMVWQRKNKKRGLVKLRADFDEKYPLEHFMEQLVENNPDLEGTEELKSIAEEQQNRERAAYAENEFNNILDAKIMEWREELGLIQDASEEDDFEF